MSKKRIATRRIYGRDSKGRAVLIAAPGQPIPDGYDVGNEATEPPKRTSVVSSDKLQGMEYPELQKLVKARGVKPKSRKRVDMIAALR